MFEVIQFIMDVKNVELICFCVNDMMEWLTIRGLKNINSVYIKHHLQSDWELKPSPNSDAYTQYRILPNMTILEKKNRSRYYQISHHFLLNFDEIDE